MRNKSMSKLQRAAGVAAIVFSGLLAASAANAAATIVIINGNAAGVGFNDPTPAAPVGGHVGTTLGQQRLIAFQAVANKWGATLTSSVTIQVLANFEPLTCTATTAVLGSAGAISVWRDFSERADCQHVVFESAGEQDCRRGARCCQRRRHPRALQQQPGTDRLPDRPA